MSADGCRSCSASIRWAITPAGKRCPIDAAPDPAGEYIIAPLPGRELMLEKFDPELHGGRARYTSHFRTCPSAQLHSRRGKAS